jgi:hypothetical protein
MKFSLLNCTAYSPGSFKNARVIYCFDSNFL